MQPAKSLLTTSLPGMQWLARIVRQFGKRKGGEPKRTAISTQEADDTLLFQPSRQPAVAEAESV